MPIHFVTGKPGGGKSMFGTHLLVRDLVQTKRTVVTNIPLNIGNLNRYIQMKFPDADVDIHERVIMLEHADVFEFYRIRSGGLILPASPDKVREERAPKMKKEEFVNVMQEHFLKLTLKDEYKVPCSYHIDEAHTYFDAREWADTGRGLTYYCSQHRHLHDEICFYPQNRA